VSCLVLTCLPSHPALCHDFSCLVPSYVLSCCAMSYCIVLYCIVLYCIVLYCIVLYCIVLYCIVLYCTVLYHIVSYRIVLYSIVLYCLSAPCSDSAQRTCLVDPSVASRATTRCAALLSDQAFATCHSVRLNTPYLILRLHLIPFRYSMSSSSHFFPLDCLLSMSNHLPASRHYK
jgi:hypothetical protein